MAAMAPGVAAALVTTVAGLLVAIPSMFGYNWLVHTLRVLTVELDNFRSGTRFQNGNRILGRGMTTNCRISRVECRGPGTSLGFTVVHPNGIATFSPGLASLRAYPG